MNISINKLNNIPVSKQNIEMVEVKGKGHPDTICDSVCNIASNELSKYYYKNFKQILHHNVDKGLLVAGKSKPKFGGGKILFPMKIIIAGRAITHIDKQKLEVHKICIDSAKKYLSKFRNTDMDNILVMADIKEGSIDLQQVFKKTLTANDTSFGASFYPYTNLESLIKKANSIFNSWMFLRKFKAVGEDMKIMGFRQNKKIKLIIAIAFVDKYIDSIESYIEIKQKVKEYLNKKLGKDIEIEINTLDDTTKKKEENIYLTITGLSGENGDDGQVGRGNRPSGLITPYRTMSLEATAGKNINHPGKLYQVLADIIAKKIGGLKSVEECYVRLLSQIGKPLNKPQICDIQIISKDFKKIEKQANKIVNDVFSNIKKIQWNIINDKYELF